MQIKDDARKRMFMQFFWNIILESIYSSFCHFFKRGTRTITIGGKNSRVKFKWIEKDNEFESFVPIKRIKVQQKPKGNNEGNKNPIP